MSLYTGRVPIATPLPPQPWLFRLRLPGVGRDVGLCRRHLGGLEEWIVGPIPAPDVDHCDECSLEDASREATERSAAA